jgi:hypothetical protein
MSDTILSTRWVIYYDAENRQKRLFRDTSVTPTVLDSVNDLYSALQDHFDELNQMDDGTPMSAQTPTEYTIGIIDAGDKDPWFIDRTSVEYLYGGALRTSSWARVQDSNTGIVRVTVNNTSIVAGDIGLDITHADGDAGTLLDVKGTGAGSILWIRPDSNAAANNWDSTSGTITCNAHTATQSAAAETGESLWANIYSLGTIEDFTQLYVYQGTTQVLRYKGTASWWEDGQIDILVNVQEVGTPTDGGYLTVFARQYGKTYDNFIVDVSAGGRNPIPLATGGDLNNDTGYRQFTGSAGSGTFDASNFIYVGASWAAATKKGVLTAVAGTTGAPILSYYLIGDLTDFVVSDAVKEYTGLADGDATCTAGAPSDIGPPTYSGITITHAYDETVDIDENGTTENYSIVIDLNSTYTVKQGYEFTKYRTRRGETGTSFTDGIEGERYIGSDYRILYSGGSGTVSEGAVVTQVTTGATGTVVANNTTDGILILRNSRGTFNGSNQVQVDGSNYVTPIAASAITPIKAAPFGTFAGGKWFCAPGVVLKNFLAGDTNNFQLVDDNGNVQVAPTKVTVQIGNTRLGDRVALFRLTSAGGVIDKTEYSGTVQSAGATTVVVGASIDVDVPGKSLGGVLFLVDTSGLTEYRLRYASWASATFTLANSTGLTADSGTDTDTIVDAGAFATAQVGDLIRNTTRSAISYITEVTDSNTVQISPAIAGQTLGDAYEINTLPVTTEVADYVYIPFIHAYETTGTDGSPGDEQVSVTYSAPIPVRARVRQGKVILPYEVDGTITAQGFSTNVIRTPDSIAT